MAPSKPLPNDTSSLANLTNAVKKYEQQYIPVTPSPLSPRSNNSSSSSRARPTTLPRRHTVSGPAPSAEAATPTPAPVVPRPVRHTRRHSGSSSSVSPTERLMRYKGALAWRSATLRRQNTPEGEGPHSAVSGTNGHAQKSEKNIPSEKEKSDFHVVFLTQPEARGRDRDRGKDRPPGPLSYHPVAEYYHPYCTDYTTTTTRPRAVFRRHLRETQGVGVCYGYSSSTGTRTTTTLQRVGFVAVAFLLGIYMLLHAFSLVIGRGTGTGTGTGTGSPNHSNGNGNSHSLLGAPTRGNTSWDMSQGYYR